MSRGDYLRVVIDVGAGQTRTEQVTASRDGRSVRRRESNVRNRPPMTFLEEVTGPRRRVITSIEVQTVRIVALVQGHEELVRARAPRKRQAQLELGEGGS